MGVGRLQQNLNSKVIILTCHYVHDLYSSKLYFSFKQQIWKFQMGNQKWCVWFLTNKRSKPTIKHAKNNNHKIRFKVGGCIKETKGQWKTHTHSFYKRSSSGPMFFGVPKQSISQIAQQSPGPLFKLLTNDTMYIQNTWILEVVAEEKLGMGTQKFIWTPKPIYCTYSIKQMSNKKRFTCAKMWSQNWTWHLTNLTLVKI